MNTTTQLPTIGAGTLCARCGAALTESGQAVSAVEDWRRGADADLLCQPCVNAYEWTPFDWIFTVVFDHPQIVRVYTRRSAADEA